MHVWKVISAIIITTIILIASGFLQSRKESPIDITARTGPFTMQHVASQVHAGKDTSPLFSVRVSGPKAPGTFKVYLMYKPDMKSKKGIPVSFARLEAPLGEEALDDYEVWLTPYAPGRTLEYYFRAELPDSTVIATLPENAETGGETIAFRFEGIPPMWLVVVHYGFIGLALFTASLAFFSSFGLIADTPALKLFGKQVFWTTVFMILGAGLFHIMLFRIVNGEPGWGGWPVGKFILADTLNEIVILFWIVLTIVLKGSIFAGGESGNLSTARTARMMGVVGFVLILAMLLIPSLLS